MEIGMLVVVGLACLCFGPRILRAADRLKAQMNGENETRAFTVEFGLVKRLVSI